MAHENNTVNKGAQKLQLSSHVVDDCKEFCTESEVKSDLEPNKSNEMLAHSITQKHSAGSSYFKTFELAVINRLQSDLMTELEALNFEAAEVIFEELLEHMSESELEQMLVENKSIDLVLIPA